MKFLLFVCAFWISLSLVHCDGHRKKLAVKLKSCKKGEYKSVLYACKKNCDVSAEISYKKGGDAHINGRQGTKIVESTECNENCFCTYGPPIKKRKRECVRKQDIGLKKKVNFVLKCVKDTKDLTLHLTGNGKIVDSPPTTKSPPITTTTTKAPEKIHEQDIGNLKQGKRKFLKVECSGNCDPLTIYVAHRDGGDIDLYGGPKKFVDDGIKCYGDHCFCVAASAHSKIDHCKLQGEIKATSYYVTVVGYQNSKDVKVFINDKNLKKVTEVDM